MTLQNTKQFLEDYKVLEGLVKEKKGLTVLDYEQTLPPERQDKLRICRTNRNYLCHVDSHFVEPTEEMIKFIRQEIEILSDKHIPVSKKAYKTCFTEKTKISEAAKFLKSKGIKENRKIPVFDTSYKPYALVGMFEVFDIIAYLADDKYSKTSKLTDIIKKCTYKKDYISVGATTYYDEVLDYLENDKIVIVAPGSSWL